MKNSKLRTDWVCVATAGDTVDGREITEQEIHDMAETYDLEYYAALMWHEHDRSWVNMGEVLEVKEGVIDGELKLFAKLAPNPRMIDMNRYSMGLFSSVEIMPNFRNTGKAYLFGLGITDQPASVGTTKLELFSQNLPKKAIAGEFIKLDFALDESTGKDEDNDEETIKSGLFAMFKKFFSSAEGKSAGTKPEPENNNNKEEITMTNEQFSQLIGAFNGLSAKIESHFSAQTKPEGVPEEPKEPKDPEAPKNGETVSKEDFNKLQNDFSALAEKFNALNKEVTPVPNGVPAEAEKFNVAV